MDQLDVKSNFGKADEAAYTRMFSSLTPKPRSIGNPRENCNEGDAGLSMMLNSVGTREQGVSQAIEAMTIRESIETIKAQTHLTRDEAREVMQLLLSGSVPDEEIVAFLAALRDKGEQADELVGFAEVMRAHAAETLRAAGVKLESISHREPLLDTCGTGGDGRGTFNVSTAAALVAAAAGVRVAKHGNRSISSRCGSADVLEALGVAIDLPLERIPAVSRRSRHGLPLCSAPAPCHEARDERAAGAEDQIGFQSPRPAYQSPGRDDPVGGRF